MTRTALFRVVDLAHSAAHSATCAASYAGVSKERADHFQRLAEEALQEAQAILTAARSPSGTVLEFAPGKAA